MDKDKLKGAVASELIIVAMETKGKRPTQLSFEEMIDVVADVVNKISAYPMLADSAECTCDTCERKATISKYCRICDRHE